MIDDNKRREVAARLRALADGDLIDPEGENDD